MKQYLEFEINQGEIENNLIVYYQDTEEGYTESVEILIDDFDDYIATDGGGYNATITIDALDNNGNHIEKEYTPEEMGISDVIKGEHPYLDLEDCLIDYCNAVLHLEIQK